MPRTYERRTNDDLVSTRTVWTGKTFRLEREVWSSIELLANLDGLAPNAWLIENVPEPLPGYTHALTVRMRVLEELSNRLRRASLHGKLVAPSQAEAYNAVWNALVYGDLGQLVVCEDQDEFEKNATTLTEGVIEALREVPTLEP